MDVRLKLHKGVDKQDVDEQDVDEEVVDAQGVDEQAVDEDDVDDQVALGYGIHGLRILAVLKNQMKAHQNTGYGMLLYISVSFLNTKEF